MDIDGWETGKRWAKDGHKSIMSPPSTSTRTNCPPFPPSHPSSSTSRPLLPPPFASTADGKTYSSEPVVDGPVADVAKLPRVIITATMCSPTMRRSASRNCRSLDLGAGSARRVLSG